MNSRQDNIQLAKLLAEHTLKRISETDMSKAPLFYRFNFASSEIMKSYDRISCFNNQDVTVAFTSVFIGTPFENAISHTEFNAVLDEQKRCLNDLNFFFAQLDDIKNNVVNWKAIVNKTLPGNCPRDEFINTFNGIDKQFAELDAMLSAMGTVKLIDTMNELVKRKDEMRTRRAWLTNDVSSHIFNLRCRIEVERDKALSLYGIASRMASGLYSLFGGSSAQKDAVAPTPAASLPASSVSRTVPM